MKAVTIKVREEVLELVDEMIRLGLASSRNQALNVMIEAGLEEVRRLVEKRKRVEKLVEKFMKEGLPWEDLPTARDVIEGRRR